MTLFHRLVVLFILGLVLNCKAQTTYNISFPNPNSHYIKVSALYSELGTDSVDIKMAVWTPGSYMVREYSRNVEGFKAVDASGNNLKVTKVRKNVWRVYQGKSTAISCDYMVYANELNVRSCFVDVDQAYINGVGLYMYTDATKDKSFLVRFNPANDWKKISTGLSKAAENIWQRTAADFDELVDAPTVLGNHTVFSFDYKGIPHHIAMVGEAKYDSVKIKNDIYKIVDECTAIFGENPNKEYTFIVHNTQSGGGGLEHRNSTSIMTARTSYENKEGYEGFLSLVAHEYFHLWIVKRVRPLELGPFDYENEVYTRQLWFFEGFTSFYDDYIVYRCGFTSEAEYLDIVKTNLQTILNTPGDKVQPVSEASYDAWVKYYRRNENSKNSQVSYYTKGAIIASVLNLDLLHRSNGKYSLDTLMNYLFHQHYKVHKRGLTDAELQQFFEKLGNTGYDDFFNKYIHGTEAIPYEHYFMLAGLELKRVDGRKKQTGYLGAVMNKGTSKTVVTEITRDSPAWNQGLSAGDEIVSFDEWPADKVTDYLKEKEPGTAIKIKLIRAGLPREITITLGEPDIIEIAFEYIRKPNDLQLTVREKWLGKHK